MLAELPALLMLVGLAAYAVLAGADFGAGFWTIFARGRRAGLEATREHARHAIGPVWEANHVWLIFVLVVCWTAYPVAFASILSTLSIPIFVAAVGIILRGVSYALRAELDLAPGRRSIENVFAVSSILTPFALGTVIGAIASGRVPVGNAQGDPIASWLSPTSLLVGALFVTTSSYLAAVYLAADARRLDEPAIEADFRNRALRVGVVAGALALAGLFVVRVDAPRIWDGLTRDGGLAMVVVSAAAGFATLVLVARSMLGPARVSAALAVAAIVAGFGVAQHPELLPGLTIEQAAAGRPTLVAIAICVAAGAIVLVPSLSLLFGLFLRGRLESDRGEETPERVSPPSAPDRSRRLGAVTLVCFAVGTTMVLFADSGWVRAAGVAALFAFAGAGFVHVATVVDE